VSRATDKLFATLNGQIRSFDATRRRVDGLVPPGHLSRRNAEQVYESLFLSSFTAFELFIDELFVTLLVTSTGPSTGIFAVPRITVRSIAIGRELIMGPGRKYVDWLPYERTLERANLFFRGGRPFTNLSSADQSLVNKAQIIRNAIAHRSHYSETRFQREVVGTTAIPQRERRPSAYLRGLVAGTPPLTRYENFMAGLLSVAKQLS
jgi:hypothetical protein